MNINHTMRAFELFLRSDPNEAGLDRFLNRIAPGQSGFVSAWRDGGVLRDQLPFLSMLYRNGVHVDRMRNSNVAAVYFGGLVTPMFFAVVRKALASVNV